MTSGIGQPPADATAPKPRQPIDAGPPTNPHPSAQADANSAFGPWAATGEQPRHEQTGQYLPKGS